MTDILGLTTTDAVRSVWGVSDSEVTDAALNYQNLAGALELQLISLDIDYSTIVAEGSVPNPSSEHKKKLLLLSDYALYFCAARVSSSVKMLALHTISDGNVTGRRFNNVLEAVTQDVNGRLIAAYKAMVPTFGLPPVQFPSLTARAVRVSDPVAGT